MATHTFDGVGIGNAQPDKDRDALIMQDDDLLESRNGIVHEFTPSSFEFRRKHGPKSIS